jgi:uncharacterized phage-associated protein
MNCKIDPRKATQVAARLIQKSGGTVEYLRLVKLAYLADRESLVKRGIPILGGRYFSMRKGPSVSELMNFVNRQNAPGWKETISRRVGNELKLKHSPDFDLLSEREIEILDSIVAKHSSLTTDELVLWCHDNCPEVEKVAFFARREISIEKILSSEHIPDQQATEVVSELESLEKLDAILN